MARTYLTVSPFGGFPRIFIATAAYQFHANYTHSLAAAMAVLASNDIPVDLCHIAEHCHVDDARNAMVREFMMSEATHLVFIDNDVGFSAENLVKLVMHDPNVDMVAGVYPLKENEEGYPVRVRDGIDLIADENGLVEVDGLPTGFLRISRNCLEKMIEKYGDRKFYGRGQSTDDLPHYILFERTFENMTRFSGDYAFCEKWKALGGKMYVDPEMHFSHSGTHEWTGTLGDYWRKQYGVTESRFKEAVQRIKSGRFDAETAAWLKDGWGNNFSASVNTLVSCWHTAKKASVILETGSGLSTLVMALSNPNARIISLESESAYMAQTLNALEECGIENVDIRLSKLINYDSGKWYEAKDLPNADLVVLDGPNRSKANRNIAYDVLNLDSATVIIDDAEDNGLMEQFNNWAESKGRTVVKLGIKQKTAAISLPRKAA
jgi:precorrin-6B methylase 2